jgi:two-component system, NtrC family, sensor histidine kinase HydH
MKSGSLTLLNALDVSPRAARAHAMKNCLTVIRAIAALCEKDLPSRGVERMSRLKGAAERIRDLLEEDLRHTAAGAAETPPASHASAACVTSLVDAVVARAADQAEHARVELFVQCAGGEIEGDSDALGEALLNLVANAIAATPEGGGVFIATYLTDEGDQCWTVQDTGGGMSSAHLAALGRRLYCAGREGGTGLGVALAQAAIIAHGGLLHIESAVAAGTTMSCWLPRSRRLR